MTASHDLCPLDRSAVEEIFADITRREVGFGLAALAALAALGGCGAEDEPAAAELTWQFVDDRGARVERARQPQRVVVYEAFLPALWELGLRPVGVLGSMPLRDNPDIAPVADRLGIALDDITELSRTYGEVNLEAMAALDAELVVTYFNARTPVLYGFADESMQESAAQLAPIVALDIHSGVPAELARVLEVSAALGVDVGSSEVRATQTDFEVASDRLRSIAAGKEGMSVLVAVPLPDGIFVAAPSIYPFARYLKDLGFDILVPRDDSATVSWELVSTELAADAVLLAAGPDYPTHEVLLDEQPTWRSHPAAAADQVASAFPNVTIPSYAATAGLLDVAAVALEGFRPLD